jgi:hypothetical protein
VPKPVFRTLIRKFSGLLDPDPLVRGTVLDLDPSIIKQKQEEKPSFLLFYDFYMTFLSLNNDVNVPLQVLRKKNKDKKYFLVAS